MTEKRWTLAWVAWPSDELEEYLSDGWEPFAVLPTRQSVFSYGHALSYGQNWHSGGMPLPKDVVNATAFGVALRKMVGPNAET